MKELSLAPGISGFEGEIAKILKRELKKSSDSIEEDSMGNVIATKKGKKGCRIDGKCCRLRWLLYLMRRK